MNVYAYLASALHLITHPDCLCNAVIDSRLKEHLSVISLPGVYQAADPYATTHGERFPGLREKLKCANHGAGLSCR